MNTLNMGGYMALSYQQRERSIEKAMAKIFLAEQRDVFVWALVFILGYLIFYLCILGVVLFGGLINPVHYLALLSIIIAGGFILTFILIGFACITIGSQIHGQLNLQFEHARDPRKFEFSDDDEG